MAFWQQVQSRAKEYLEKGKKLFSEGKEEAGYLAETTARAAVLQVTLRKNRVEKYRALHDLGNLVFSGVQTDPRGTAVRLTEPMLEIIRNIRGLEAESQKVQRQIGSFSIVRKEAVSMKRGKRRI